MRLKETFLYALALVISFQTAGSIRACADPFSVTFNDKPEHLMLVVIDGLSYKALDRFNLPVLSRMAACGTLVERNYLPPAAHPRTGAYAELHTCSIPNPIMMAGTVFITPETRYLQDSFAGKTTAFIANAIDYRTLNVGYTYSYQKDGSDFETARMALTFMEMGRPAFLRVHLQWAGEAGAQFCSRGAANHGSGICGPPILPTGSPFNRRTAFSVSCSTDW